MSCLSASGYRQGECIRASAARTVALARLTAMTLIAVDNAKRAVDNFRMQYDISKRGLLIAKEEQDHLENTYWPRELAFLNEFANPHLNRDGVEAIESVEVLGRRYAGRLISAIADRFAKKIHEVRCEMTRYNTSANRKGLQDLLLMQAQLTSTARVLGRSVAFVEFMVREEKDWNRRLQAVSIGRGLMGQVKDLMQSAGQAYGRLGESALSGLNSALGGMGNAFQEIQSANRIRAGDFYNPYPEMANSATAPYQTTGGRLSNIDYWGAGGMFGNSQSGTMGANSYMQFDGNQAAGMSSTSQSYSNAGQSDHFAAAGTIGAPDLVRGGTFTFPVLSGPGLGEVTINLDVFGLYDARKYGTMANAISLLPPTVQPP